MECGINFRSPESQEEYFKAYEKTMQLFSIEVQEEYVHTEFGESHVIKAGNINNPPLVSKPDYINTRIVGFLEG